MTADGFADFLDAYQPGPQVRQVPLDTLERMLFCNQACGEVEHRTDACDRLHWSAPWDVEYVAELPPLQEVGS